MYYRLENIIYTQNNNNNCWSLIPLICIYTFNLCVFQVTEWSCSTGEEELTVTQVSRLTCVFTSLLPISSYSIINICTCVQGYLWLPLFPPQVLQAQLVLGCLTWILQVSVQVRAGCHLLHLEPNYWLLINDRWIVMIVCRLAPADLGSQEAGWHHQCVPAGAGEPPDTDDVKSIINEFMWKSV